MWHVLSSGLLVRKLLIVKGFTKKFYHGKNFECRCKRKSTSFEGGIRVSTLITGDDRWIYLLILITFIDWYSFTSFDRGLLSKKGTMSRKRESKREILTLFKLG